MSQIYIQTPRLILRQWQESDYEPFISMNMDTEVMRYFPGLRTREDTLAQIERIKSHFAQHGFGFYALERRDTGAFIGFTGLCIPGFESFFTPCVEIGWRLGRSNWNMGFAQEAARSCLQYGFDTMGLNEIYSFTSIHNLPSINVMKKTGMMQTGYFEHPNLPDGHTLKTHVLYKIEKRNRAESRI